VVEEATMTEHNMFVAADSKTNLKAMTRLEGNLDYDKNCKISFELMLKQEISLIH